MKTPITQDRLKERGYVPFSSWGLSFSYRHSKNHHWRFSNSPTFMKDCYPIIWRGTVNEGKELHFMEELDQVEV